MYHPADRFSIYLWRHLEPATNYSFTVSACSAYTRECGEASRAVAAATEDGLSGPPTSAEARCGHDNVSGMNFVEVRWEEPKNKFGQIEFYNVSRKGFSTYVEKFLYIETIFLDPLERPCPVPGRRRSDQGGPLWAGGQDGGRRQPQNEVRSI